VIMGSVMLHSFSKIFCIGLRSCLFIILGFIIPLSGAHLKQENRAYLDSKVSLTGERKSVIITEKKDSHHRFDLAVWLSEYKTFLQTET
jgi:hypothetical protein